MASAVLPVPSTAQTTRRFYHPELDALRFFAFLSVFFTHAPRFDTSRLGTGWKHTLALLWDEVSFTSVYGLCLFFFLSSFLITALLLREQERTGTIHLRRFYARRLLRIWPLYYWGVLLGLLAGFVVPAWYWGRHEVVEMVFFVGYLGGTLRYNPASVLWSISVEELFYAVWPFVARTKPGHLRGICWTIIALSLAWAVTRGNDWYNPIPHFLYFASGALLALWLHDRRWILPTEQRLACLGSGVLLWAGGRQCVLHGSFHLGAALCFAFVDLGCLVLFLGLWQAPWRFPAWLLYLGRISYGLYVYHRFALEWVSQWLVPRLIRTPHAFLSVLLTDALAFALTAGIAALSFRFLETPFLRWKARLEVVKTS